MNPELKELYQEVIIDHGRRPRNKGVMTDCTCMARGKNPLCGDQLTVYLKINSDQTMNISFEGQGCAISMASASLMTEQLNNKSEVEARQVFKLFHEMLTLETSQTDDPRLHKLSILAGVKEYPARVKCATLAWHTLMNALNHSDSLATTE